MRRAVVIVIAAYLLLVLIDRFVLVELLFERIGIPLLFAAAAALACIGAGMLAMRGRRDPVLNLVIGYPLFGTLCFLVALVRISPWTLVPVIGVLGGFGIVSLAAAGRNLSALRPSAPLVAVAIALVFLAAFIAAQAPPTTLDEPAYHLAVPWTWVKAGHAIELPLNSHSYFPMGVESADLPFLAILGQTAGGIASHLLHWIAALAVTALLLRTAKDCPILAAAIVVTPALAVTAGWSLVDWPLLGVSLVFVEALDSDDRPAAAAALAAGLLVKYTFIPLALIGLVVTRRFRGLWPGLIAGSVFLVRNAVLTANPVAPFFTALAPHVSSYRAGAFLSDYVFAGNFVDESLGASMWMACTLVTGLLSWALVGAGALLFLLAPSSRVLVPFFAVPAARAGSPNRPMRVLLAVAIAVQLLLIGWFSNRGGAFGLMAGSVSDEQYLAGARASIPLVMGVDAMLPADSRTLVVGLSETYWFQHDVRGGGNFDGPRVSNYLQAGSAEALYSKLKRDGFTHVAVLSAPPPTRVQKKIEERETALSPEAKRTLALTLDAYAANVTSRGGATLFALR